MKKTILSIFFFCLAMGVRAQQITIEEYIATYKEIAVREMQRTGIPASITLAQGILEAQAGNSPLVKMSNNHFGIKCKNNWTGESVSHDDDEKQECFRKYASAEESYIDHSNFLKQNKRYAMLFELELTDYKGWAKGLKKCGYATDPRYANILISNIEKYDLTQYDKANALAIPDNLAVVEEVLITNEGVQQIGMQPAKEGPEIKNEKAGKTKFNGIKAIFAKKGTSLFALAENNKIQLSKLLEYNDMGDESILAEDQIIYLDKKHKQGKQHSYTAANATSLREISQTLGIQLRYLKEYNQFTENEVPIARGSVIYLRPKG